MNGNRLLRSTLSVLVCLLAAGAIGRNFSVQAQSRTTEGSLLAISEGKIAGPCPLKRTDVKTEISGFIARVVVTQHFENPYPDKIEAVYTFPLPQAAAVDDMTIVVGNRTINGKIMRREEAQATYNAARERGQTAALLNQERPNIFTQAVANILPGQQIDVKISYVETLKYDEGSYEWSFPMVVGERYIPANEEPAAQPASSPAANEEAQADETQPATNARVPDADRITPPVMPKGMRAGHDVSIEVSINAGVPLVAFRSVTHEIEAVQPSAERAEIRLKDQATIPNKDFIIKYDVAGARIEDALLTHRQGNDGFFTFILQPPQRVTAADVMPKELVFVLDTSGSMSGFPIEKAKETMMLALDGLYPQDTFNLITFAGDTRILFPAPVRATKENVASVKKLLAGLQGYGGTEMMKAIRASLEPSDAQDHVRIVCFMTDGEVGNDMEIISEVQKHPNARVFAMGFSGAPNRYLLDKIAEYGRGEVDYVTENGDAKDAARRFHERVRNPLLTDVSIDWSGLPVADIYPKSIPDLFSAKPVIVFGRYHGAGQGVIRLKGMMSGREVVREIPVQLPEQEAQHDVLATLWARKKIDELMGQDLRGAQVGSMRHELKTAVTELGLNYRLMTQFTSFVAVEENGPADGVAPRRVDVPVESTSGDAIIVSREAATLGTVNETVTVSSGGNEVVNTTQAQLGYSVRSVADLPNNGRGLNTLTLLAPGVAPSGGVGPSGLSTNGQRPRSNNFTIDGLDNNSGIAPGGQSPGASVAGGAPPATVAGGTNPLSSLAAVQEVAITTANLSAEFGRNTGAQIAVVTKGGTNDFHGSAFYFFGHDALDANDWFGNSRGLRQAPHRLAEFGGTFGGPIRRDKWFFFGAFEGLRLSQPVVSLTDVPSLTARLNAPASTRPLLNFFPLPNGPDRGDGFAEFASAFANKGHHDSVSSRIDANLSTNLTVSGNFNFTRSSADERGAGGFSLNTLNRTSNQAESLAGRLNYTISPNAVAEVKVGYNRLNWRSAYMLDQFGGAVLPPESIFSPSSLFSANGGFTVDLNAHNARLMAGAPVTNTQRQFSALGLITMVHGNHSIKFGGDYRRLFPRIGLRQQEQAVLFDGVTQALAGQAARVGLFTHAQSQRPVFNEFSTYAEDDFRIKPDLTVTYGLRWDLSLAPDSRTGGPLAVTQTSNPAQLTFASAGTRLWRNTFGNFAPRISVAYQPHNHDSWVVRGGFGIIYDTTNSAVGEVYADSYPLLNGQSQINVPFSFTPTPSTASFVMVPFSIIEPNLKMPYVMQWNASIQRELNRNNVVSAAYVANAGRRLLTTDTLLNQNAGFPFLRLTDNRGSSNYQSLQVQFERRFTNRIGAMVRYTLAKGLDNFSDDIAARALLRSTPALERGASDFDIRHTLAGTFSYQLPDFFDGGFRQSLFRGWSVDAIFNARSSSPVNVVYAVPTSYGFIYLRPDLNAGVPLNLSDALAAGGRRINPAAFSVPADFRQGSLGRNTLRGFPMWQINLGLHRDFQLNGDAKLVLGIEAINLFNRASFAAPAGDEASLGTRFAAGGPITMNQSFGQSFTNAARSAMGVTGSTFGANYYPGGPRVLRLSAKFEF